jgi:apolipoprotein D and lipocalin family protein
MKRSISVLLANLFVSVGFTACHQPSALQTVAHVDLNRYSGTWYEIASYLQSFERGCSNVKATYTLKGDYVEVHNEAIKNGKKKENIGKAFVVANSGNAKLKVQFFWPFKGEYWIIGLADDYSWAIVSSPKLKTLWILSRTPKMEEGLYRSLVESLVKRGFEEGKIVKMVQE